MENLERRAITGGVKLEGDGSGKKYLTGYAIVFNSESRDLGGFTEIISPQAIQGADMSDTVALFNHRTEQLLGRVTSGTLKLEIDDKGVFYRIELPNTTLGKDIEEMVKRGDLRGSSFAFSLPGTNAQTWTKKGDKRIRTINKFGTIYDVSPVTTPAYPDTQVALRSMEQAFQEEQQEEQEQQEERQVPARTADMTEIRTKYLERQRFIEQYYYKQEHKAYGANFESRG